MKINIIQALNLNYENKGFSYGIDEMKIKYDLESFFDFYKVINAKALSERIGMNQSLKKPSATQTKRILKGVQQIGKELTEVSFLL